MTQREWPVLTFESWVAGIGRAAAGRHLGRRWPARHSQPLGWGCVAHFVDISVCVTSVKMLCAATNLDPEDRDSVERVTGIEPAWPAWKAD